MLKYKEMIDEFIRHLESRKVLYSSNKIKGVTYINSNLSVLIENFLKQVKEIFLRKEYSFLQLPVFVKGEDFLLQCKYIKDFSNRVFWGDPLKNNDLHVFNSTVEAQISSLLAYSQELLKRRNSKFFFIRQIGRYESGKTIPFWKERLISFFVESQTLHLTEEDRNKVIDEMNDILTETYKKLLINAFFIERFKDSKRLNEYSQRRLETVAMDPGGNFSILSSIYDLGDSFSRVFNVKIGGKFPLMLNFAYSARLFLLMLIKHFDGIGLLYPYELGECGICVILNNKEKEPELKDTLDKNKVSYKIIYSIRNEWKEEFVRLKERGIPLIIVIKDDGSWVYQRIYDKKIDIEDLSGLSEMNLHDFLSQHNNILKQRQQKSLNDNIYIFDDMNFDILKEINKKIIISGLCSKSNCLFSAKDKLEDWDVLGYLLEKDERTKKCLVCGVESRYSILLGKKIKTDK